MWSFRTLSALLLLSMWGGCKKEEDVEYPPSPPQNFVPADAAAPPPAPAAATDAGSADAGPPDLDSATKQTLGFAVEKRAAKDAKGMSPVGELFGARLAEGAHVASNFMINTGKCYSVIAVGEPSVSEVDIQIFNPGLGLPGGPGTVIAVDNTSGSEAAISPCWKHVFPMGFPARVVVTVKRGSGAVAARVYVK